MTPGEEYERYELLHRTFSKTYSKAYRHVMDFYPLPQQFMQEAKPDIDSYVEKLSASGDNPGREEPFKAIFCFTKNFQAFASDASNVFEEYKELYSESGNYIKKVFKLKERDQGLDTGAAEFAKLVPVLNKLIVGFKRIEEKTEENASRLQQLKNEWRRLKANITPENNGAAWPL